MTPLAQSIGPQLADLEKTIRELTRETTPDAGFARFVYFVAEEEGPVAESSTGPDTEAARSGHAPALAALGFAAGLKSEALDAEFERAGAEGLTRLSARDPFPSDHQTFVFRPIELLGIALLLSRLAAVAPELRSWFKAIATQLENEASADYWSRWLGAESARIGGAPWKAIARPDLGSLLFEELALYRWLQQVPGFIGETSATLSDVDQELLRHALTTALHPQDAARAAISHHSLRSAVHARLESDLRATWLVKRDTQDAVETIASICRRFHLFARQLQNRHAARKTLPFDDEYDVQDAMHALLKLHFDDVRAEEWTPSYGGNSSRIDFLLKRERVVVEVKMTRKSLRQKDVVDELINDKERYRAHPDYRTMVCFVYDPVGYCDNPSALEDDVSESEGDFRVAVVVSPHGV